MRLLGWQVCTVDCTRGDLSSAEAVALQDALALLCCHSMRLAKEAFGGSFSANSINI